MNTPKSYGKSIKVSDLPDGIARFFPVAPENPSPESTEPSAPSFGLPKATLIPIIESIWKEIEEIEKAFQVLSLRMVGGSLLILYEADWEKAAEAVKSLQKEKSRSKTTGYSEEEEEAEDEDDEDTDEEEGPAPAYVVKMIDFAHTRIKPHEGPDKGVLTGMDTLLSLLNDRIVQIGGKKQERTPITVL